MAKWRDQKYVVDSDEEEEGLSIDETDIFGQHEPPSSIQDGFVDIDHFAGLETVEFEKQDGLTQTVQNRREASVVTTVEVVEEYPHNTQLRDEISFQRVSKTNVVPQAVTRAFASYSDDDEKDELQLGQAVDLPALRPVRIRSAFLRMQDHPSTLDDEIDELQQNPCSASSSPLLSAQLRDELPPYVQGNRSSAHETYEAGMPNQQHILASVSSSPLSTVTSTPPRNTSPSPGYKFSTDNVEGLLIADTSLRSEQDDISNTEQPKSPRSLSLVCDGRSRRALRQRNPIQMHPYLLEGEMYRKSLRARGIKPLRIDQREIDEAPTSDTQRREEPDEFPDVSSLLRNPPGTIVQGNKRRKITHTFSRKEQKYGKQGHAPLAVVIDSSMHPDAHHQASVNHAFDVPPSPPLSTESAISRREPPITDHFRFPPGTTFTQTHTPIISSELEMLSVGDVDNDVESETHLSERSVHRGLKEGRVATDSSSDSSESESEHQLVRVQRKIRGVLPASWLRLDLKTQDKKAVVARASTGERMSPTKGFLDKGVARPVSSHKHREIDWTQDLAVEISGDSSSDRDMLSNSHQPRCPEELFHDFSDAEVSVFPTDVLEGMEDNRIDWMLPPKSRQRLSQPTKKSRQTRLERTGQAPKHNRDTGRLTKRVNASNRQATRFRPPRLSILDASKTDTATKLPKFVLVAARTTRSRKDKGRHSPLCKHLRLATREDTVDVQDTLTKWQQGVVLGQTSNATRGSGNEHSGRNPLQTRSGNSQTHLNAIYLPEVEGDENGHRLGHSATLSPDYEAEQSYLTPKRISNYQPRPRPSIKAVIEKIVNINTHSELKARKGQLSSFVRASYRSKPAVLESKRASVGFSRRRQVIDKKIPGPDRLPILEPQSRLESYLESSCPAHSIQQIVPLSPQYHALNNRPTPSDPVRNQPRARKTNPRRLEIDTSKFRQDGEPPSTSREITGVSNETSPSSDHFNILRGLESFGNEYTTSFDIFPLVPGIYFDSKTFLGSGDFSEALQLTNARDLNLLHPPTIWHIGEKSFEWGAWNDSVSSELGITYSRIEQALQGFQNTVSYSSCSELDMEVIVSIQRSVIAYISRSLHFLDPIDRLCFLQRTLGLATIIIDELSSSQPSASSPSAANNSNRSPHVLHIHVSMLNLVVLHQLSLIASHELVIRTTRDDITVQLHRAARQVVASSLWNGFNSIRHFQQLLPGETVNADDLENQCVVEAIVLTNHVTKRQTGNVGSFWKYAYECINPLLANSEIDVRVLDRQWHDLLSLLPLLELDTNGVIVKDRRSTEPLDGWSEIKYLICPVLDAYISTSRAQGPTFNSYCRAVLSRCFMLIQRWGWRRCETLIGTFFDFFGRISLGNLRNETVHGSPAFLEHFTDTLELEVIPEDRCFHIFLKLLGLGLREMRGIYPDKKIRDIIFRMMPNHDRRHPKDEAISQEDLDALRNHHDLVCVLYWASPNSFRPRLSIIRNLTQLEDSHKEAYHLSIRAWSNLVSYHLSTLEPALGLEPFTEWYNDIISQLLRQHSLARSEVEAQVKLAESTGDRVVPKELQESTIARNQWQVEALLSDALLSLRRAISVACGADRAGRLLSTCLAQVFELFDAEQPRVNNVIIQALDVVLEYTKQFKATGVSDDSQDYGDVSVFEDELADFLPARSEPVLEGPIYASLRCLLSNCFGADKTPEDPFLVRVVQAWCAAAQLLVGHGSKTWSDYIGPYGNDSWQSLGDTEQKRKFSDLFLATLIEKDKGVYRAHKQLVLKSWITSLVEREALLKFQHQLTNVILNTDCHNPLFSNLPFWTENISGCYNVTLAQFRERRTSLISCLLSNMRESFYFSTYHDLPEKATQKSEYTELLKQLMSTLKHNYQELGQSSGMRGAYVDFVHIVVENLQQHCTDICLVDRYFTNPDVFPLPAADPSYVVGRLKNYGLRLQEPKGAKQLCVFFRAVSERAAVESQQHYLVDQLSKAMSNNFENGEPGRFTLRSFVVQAILPAYAHLALSNPCGSLLASPLLQALEKVLRGVIEDLDGFQKGSVIAIQKTILTLFECLHSSTTSLATRYELLENPFTVKVLRLYFAIIRCTLPALDYITRLRYQVDSSRQYLSYFDRLGQLLTDTSLSHCNVFASTRDEILPLPEDEQVAGIRSFAFGELQKSLQTDWSVHDGHFYFTKGRTRCEISVNIGSLEEEKNGLFVQVQAFTETLRNMPWLDEDEEKPCLRPKSLLGTESLIF